MKLLFIGNSHTYYKSMPDLVRRLLEGTGQKTHVTMLAVGGKGLAYHLTTPGVPFNIRCGGYDAVIAQELVSGFDPVSFAESAKTLCAMAEKAGSAFYLYMPWAARDNRGAQRDMTDAYQNFCRANKCFFAPVGEVFGKLLLDLPADALYREDGHHATLLGSYAAAVTIFYTVTGRKRILQLDKENSLAAELGLPVELCQRVHTEACRIVRLFNG